MADLYAMLGVSKKASKKELREAYYTLAKKFHPDKNNGIPQEEFAKISNAYKILSNPKQRRLYDKTGIVDNADLRTIAIQVLASLFHQVIGNPSLDVRTTNLLDKMAEILNMNMNQTKNKVSGMETVRTRLKDVRVRISGKDHFFMQMIDSHLDQIKIQLATSQKDIEVGKMALKMLKEYKYTVDERPGKGGLFSNSVIFDLSQ